MHSTIELDITSEVLLESMLLSTKNPSKCPCSDRWSYDTPGPALSHPEGWKGAGLERHFFGGWFNGHTENTHGSPLMQQEHENFSFFLISINFRLLFWAPNKNSREDVFGWAGVEIIHSHWKNAWKMLGSSKTCLEMHQSSTVWFTFS